MTSGNESVQQSDTAPDDPGLGLPYAPSARVILDSISPLGQRITTMEVRMHRFVLAEFNTHRVLSRNSASSRAIPVEKQLAQFSMNFAHPVRYPREQPGMQGGDELDGQDRQDAKMLLAQVHQYTRLVIGDYLRLHPDKSTRLHKSIINRLMEWGQYHVAVVTSTEWQNFFDQRALVRSPLAQPEIAAAADAMLAAYEASEPRMLGWDDWHMPYIDWQDAALSPAGARQASVARCARVATMHHDGKRNIDADLRLFKNLVSAKPMHASPLEHVAKPCPREVPEMGYPHHPEHLGNFDGWAQLRHLPEFWTSDDGIVRGA